MPDDAPRAAEPADSGPARAPFRLLVVPGTTPGRWVRTWTERLPGLPLELVHATVAEQVDLLRSGAADAGLFAPSATALAAAVGGVEVLRATASGGVTLGGAPGGHAEKHDR